MLETILQFFNDDLSAKIASFLVIVFSILKAAKILVTLTATTKDDEFVAKVEQILSILKKEDEQDFGKLVAKSKPTLAQKFWKAI
jgi:hypothetical protein